MISSPRLSSGFLSRLLLFVVVAAVFLAYKPSLNNDFVNWDDDVHLLENRFIRSLDWKKFKEIFSTTVNHTYIPLTTLSFAVEYNRFGLDPFPYHFDNLLLHLLVTALVMVLARRLGLSVAASGLAALIFGIHPQHVESVAWVTERKDVLYSVFYLLSILVYLRFIDSRRRRFLCLSIGFGFLSILSKSMALSLPIVLLLCDWFYAGKIRWRDIFNKGYYFAFLIPVAWMSYYSNADILKIHSWNDVLVWMWCFNFYLMKFIVPGTTALFYPLPFPVSIHNFAYLSNLIIFLAICAWLWVRRNDRLVVFAFFFYLGSIFFVLRFHVTLDSVVDRFMYLPSVGLCMLTAVGIERALRYSQKNFLSFYVILFALVAILSGAIQMTSDRALAWKDSVSLWQNQLANNPTTAKWLAFSELGDAYLKDAQVQRALNRLAQDHELIDRGLFNSAYAAHQRQQDTDKVIFVVDLYRKAIEDKPDYAEPYFNLGKLYRSLGDVPTAMHFFEQACRRDRKHFMAFLRLGDIYRQQGRASEAVEFYTRAIMINPQNEEILSTVEQAYQRAIAANDHREVYLEAQDQLKSLGSKVQ